MKVAILLGAVLVCATLAPAAGTSTSFTPAPHRDPPIASNIGTTAKPLRVVVLVPSSYPDAGQLKDFGTTLSSTVWLEKVAKGWNIPWPGQASLAYEVNDMPALTSQNRTIGDYQDYVFRKMKIAAIGKLSGYQTIYILFIPCTNPFHMDSFGCVSHHPSIDPTRAAPAGGTEGSLFVEGDSMAVVLGSPSADRDGQTTAASHETAEAATNTKGVGQWRFHTDHPDTPWLDAPPWIRATDTIEMADMAAGTHWYEHVPTGETFRYERIYSNKASRANGDPDVPPSPLPYYSVFTEKDWLPFSGASRADVTVKGWATASLPAWKVTASVAVWRNKKAGAADPCSLPKKVFSIKNGTDIDVKVDIAHPNGPTSWCTLKLESVSTTKNKKKAQGDDSHFWNVGLMIGKA
jgi:hypothetical protein